ncbi:hypothetical protein [Bdellovibrio sp. BCCA]|uniref:hypothetical protein n=1 Tax=Bdellovibrio sp. BCCA TaxID=3136281 RepID=UPI0030F32E2A
MKFLVISALVLVASSSFAFEANPGLLQKYYKGSFTFDGTKIANNDSGTSFNNKERWAKSKNSNGQYDMNWGSENIEGSDVLTLNETLQTNRGNSGSSVFARTSSFYKNKLRATTTCYGDASAGSGLSPAKNNLKCVTATKRSCDRLMKAYNAEGGKNKMSSKTAESCMNFLGSYANMAKAFGNQSLQVEKRHNDVIEQDLSRLKDHIKNSTGNKTWSFTSLSSATTSEELDKTAQEFSNSMDGIKAINAAVQACAESINDFDGASSGSRASSSTASPGVR